MLKKQLQQHDEATLELRLSRGGEIDKLKVIPSHYFASASAECYELYKNGHYYGCISLIQAVAETLLKFLCETHKWKPDDDFKKNLLKLKKRGFINDDLETNFDIIWIDRNDYHHLNKEVEQEHQKLKNKAQEILDSLNFIERYFFNSTFNKGVLIPDKPRYWGKIENGKSQVFLRME